VLATELEAPEITAEDIKHIKELSENKNILTILS
jgi:DNA replication licensing factor MCM3